MAKKQTKMDKAKAGWVKWLKSYGADKFFDAFVRTAQYAESRCVNCEQEIYLDIVEGGGAPDWRTAEGDYGCEDSPDTDDEGVGSHVPVKGQFNPF